MAPTLPFQPDDLSSGPASKGSLLWAYQLRKEHVHLVRRLEDTTTDLLAYSSKVTEHQQTLSNLETLLKGLQTENYDLKNEVTTVRDKFATSLELVNKRVTAIFTAWQERVREEGVVKKMQGDLDDVAAQVKELAEGMAEVKLNVVNVENKCECLATKQLELARLNQGKVEVLKKAEKSPSKTRAACTQTVPQPKMIVVLRYGKTKVDKNTCKTASQMMTIQDSIIDEAAISTMTDSWVPDSMPVKNPISYIEAIFQRIKQETRNLHEYYTFAAELRFQLPRRKQEGHMVEVFFDGLRNDQTVKAAMEKYLDDLGWVWSNIENFCNHFKQPPTKQKQMKFVYYNTRSKAKAGAKKRKQNDISS
ncbi:hypothetical protein BGW36DRAFT_399270 [Talaromyces proteolyticus]|uniref:Uncharacterized protein n=1 Tax=Talaromyces proteolyticus TaxID=1131652 RepID=A0AAD4KLS2_9EURO|nr:uncharacterized protein BGW36DRAFT_399270 [Talaromyces proteolyticus]KAH8694114.1 hypothetical protein BGW36DRAFT_399270 [Talaromyces proteolyticus]